MTDATTCPTTRWLSNDIVPSQRICPAGTLVTCGDSNFGETFGRRVSSNLLGSEWIRLSVSPNTREDVAHSCSRSRGSPPGRRGLQRGGGSRPWPAPGGRDAVAGRPWQWLRRWTRPVVQRRDCDGRETGGLTSGIEAGFTGNDRADLLGCVRDPAVLSVGAASLLACRSRRRIRTSRAAGGPLPS
jgi:hypothetical protein